VPAIAVKILRKLNYGYESIRFTLIIKKNDNIYSIINRELAKLWKYILYNFNWENISYLYC